ncbi:MAG: hypothetical protein J3K34DRAFT_445315 [Monoraphidium minutum]|nr:MAG: hypothetical protein J3K34DRAFT_445315 [Monoraphidium minutum]
MALAAAQQRLSARSSSSTVARPAIRPAIRPRAVVVRAATLPQGVSTPKRTPQSPELRFGFVNWAEKINGRFAMMGLMGTLLVEAIAHKGFFELLGFTTGQGLGFEL